MNAQKYFIAKQTLTIQLNKISKIKTAILIKMLLRFSLFIFLNWSVRINTVLDMQNLRNL